jgi:hypothetical protein
MRQVTARVTSRQPSRIQAVLDDGTFFLISLNPDGSIENRQWTLDTLRELRPRIAVSRPIPPPAPAPAPPAPVHPLPAEEFFSDDLAYDECWSGDIWDPWS